MFLTQQGGLLGPFAWIFGKLLDILYSVLADSNGVTNLGICLILFTIIVKVILIPINYKSSKSAKINTLIQPEMAKIQKKYKDKKDQVSMMKQQEEIRDLYDRYGTSMTSGCLPALIQFPIIMGLYRVIQNIPAYVGKIKEIYMPIAQAILDNYKGDTQQFLVDYVEQNKISGASYAAKRLEVLENIDANNVIDVISNIGVSDLSKIISDMGMQDTLIKNVDKINDIYSFGLGINISEAPGYRLTWALVIPFISVIFNFISMKISMVKTGENGNEPTDATAAATNNAMKSMMYFTPLMSLFIGITLPAGIGIYWAASAIIGVFIQIGMNFYFNHCNMDKLLERQVARAEKKKAKRAGKQSFLQKMMDSSEEMQKELEKQQAMKKNAAVSLKSYVPSEKSQKAVENRQGKKYKEGSIGSKANIMMNYNHNKEEN